MAVRGQKTIPLTLLKGRGTARPDRHGKPDEQIQVEHKTPKQPRIGHRYLLDTEGRKEWKRVTRVLENAGVLTEADRSVLTQYCLLWQQMLDDPEEFKAAQHTQLRLCAVELGFSPSSRARLRTSE